MNTYEGELVLDPFMGSGTTGVAAVRTGRHFIGYDTDAGYAAAAMTRIGGESMVSQVQLAAGSGRATDPLIGGWAAKDLAKSLLADAGYTGICDEAKVLSGVQPTLSALDWNDRRWWFEVVGGRTSNRPGAQRIELLWRAIAKGAIVREADPSARFGVLTTGLPAAASGGSALNAVTGPEKPVWVVIDVTHPDAVASLRAAGRR